MAPKSSGTLCAPWGLDGGGEGATGRVEVHREGEPVRIMLKDDAALQPGDRVAVYTGGGGGYGDPKRRDPAAAAHDIAMGYVTSKGGPT